MMIRRMSVTLLCVLGLVTGCVELQIILQGGPVDADGNGIPSDNGNDSGNGNGGNGGNGAIDPPTVQLSASNVNPQLNEEVILTCAQTGGDDATSFSFQSPDAPLTVNQGATSATARFVVSEDDIGMTIRITCTAANAAGTGPTSNAVEIIGSAPP